MFSIPQAIFNIGAGNKERWSRRETKGRGKYHICKDSLSINIPQDNPYAKRINLIGTLGYVVVVTIFSTIFWIVAFIEFIKPASEYMDKKIE